MKHTKRWVSLLLAVMMTVAAPLSAFAAWEDGFVIPGQNSGSNSYDDLFWETTNKSDSVRKGIEAIELKMQGYSGRDIAEWYHVKPNYITACISRAQKHLRQDVVFVRKVA